MDISTAAVLVALIASVGIVIDTIEVLCARGTLDQLFDWDTIHRNRPWFVPGFGPIEKIVGEPLLKVLIVAHAVAAAASVFALAHGVRYIAFATLFVAGMRRLLQYRYPRSISAADHMQVLIWISLSVFAVAGEGLGQVAALAFIGAHSLLAYLTAGLAKLSVPSWREGTAVGKVLESDVLGLPRMASVIPLGLFSLVASWSTLAFEIGGPALAVFSPRAVLVFCAVAALFHAGVALTMGLVQFFFSFGATYPAIYWTALYMYGEVQAF